MAQDVVNCLGEARNGGSVAVITKELGDILIMTTARSTQKIYMPLLLMIYMWRNKVKRFNWSFSGTNMIKYYSELCIKGQIVFLIRSGRDKIKTSEAVFSRHVWHTP